MLTHWNGLLYGLVLTFSCLLVGCNGDLEKKTDKNCENINTVEGRYNCYSIEMRQKIYSQFDILIENLEVAQEPVRGNLIGIPKAIVELDVNGNIKNISLDQSSGSATFDQLLLQSIEGSAPFNLPINNLEKARLQKFEYSITF